MFFFVGLLPAFFLSGQWSGGLGLLLLLGTTSRQGRALGLAIGGAWWVQLLLHLPDQLALPSFPLYRLGLLLGPIAWWAALDLLTEEHEVQLMRSISRFPETIDSAARLRSPHLLAHYLHSLATDLHSYYNAHQFLIDDENLRNARLNLIYATRTVLAKGLGLLGVSAPEEM